MGCTVENFRAVGIFGGLARGFSAAFSPLKFPKFHPFFFISTTSNSSPNSTPSPAFRLQPLRLAWCFSSARRLHRLGLDGLKPEAFGGWLRTLAIFEQ